MLTKLSLPLALSAAFLALPAHAQDATGGKRVFETRCIGCHALEQNRVGPALATVIGRKAGTAPDFNYSDALKKAGHVWDTDKLQAWLINPQAFVPGALMPFRLGEAQERAAVAAYLASLSRSESENAIRGRCISEKTHVRNLR